MPVLRRVHVRPSRKSKLPLYRVDNSQLTVERLDVREIELLRDLNRKRTPCRFMFDDDLRVPFDEMQPGDSLFVPGYTTNSSDSDPGLRKMSVGYHTRNNTLVWSTRSTVENGVKGVRIYRNA